MMTHETSEAEKLGHLREELAARERELDVAYRRIDQLILATRHLPAGWDSPATGDVATEMGRR